MQPLSGKTNDPYNPSQGSPISSDISPGEVRYKDSHQTAEPPDSQFTIPPRQTSQNQGKIVDVKFIANPNRIDYTKLGQAQSRPQQASTEPEKSTIAKFFESIINFFANLFGNKPTTQPTQPESIQPAPVSSNAKTIRIDVNAKVSELKELLKDVKTPFLIQLYDTKTRGEYSSIFAYRASANDELTVQFQADVDMRKMEEMSNNPTIKYIPANTNDHTAIEITCE